MNADIKPFAYPTNVAPERDAEILVDAVQHAIQQVGVESFARSLASDGFQQLERLAA